MKPADMIILLVAMGINIALYAAFNAGGKADEAMIRVGDGAVQRVSLAEDRELHVTGLLGEVVLEVRDRAIRVLHAPCRNGLCLRQGWLRLGGESAVCLPSGLSIEIVARQKRFDSTVY